MSAAARSNDPWTSWAAALSVTDIRTKQAAVLHCFATHGQMSLSQLVPTYVAGNYPRQSESGIRTRCSELVDKGLVVDTGQSRRHDITGRPERILAPNIKPTPPQFANGKLFP